MLQTKTTLIPLDLSHQVLGTQAIRRTQLYGLHASRDSCRTTGDSPPSPLRALFTQILSFFAGTYAEVFAISEGPPLHDPLAVAAAIAPDMFDDRRGERFRVEIVTEGLHSVHASEVGELGRTKVARLSAGEGGCRIPRGVDLARFWDAIERAMQRAEAVSPMAPRSLEELEKEGVFRGIQMQLCSTIMYVLCRCSCNRIVLLVLCMKSR